MIIYLVAGTKGSGKDTVANTIGRLENAPVFGLSDALRIIAQERGLDMSDSSLASLGKEIRDQHGPAGVAKLVIEQLPKDLHVAVVHGIRNPDELKEFEDIGETRPLFVDANLEDRFRRVQTRARAGDNEIDFKKFVEYDRAVIEGKPEGMGQNVGELERIIDKSHHIRNNDLTEQEINDWGNVENKLHSETLKQIQKFNLESNTELRRGINLK